MLTPAGISGCLDLLTEVECRWSSLMTTVRLVEGLIFETFGRKSGVPQMKRGPRCRSHLPANCAKIFRTITSGATAASRARACTTLSRIARAVEFRRSKPENLIKTKNLLSNGRVINMNLIYDMSEEDFEAWCANMAASNPEDIE